MSFRLAQSFAWEQQFGETRRLLADTQRVIATDLEEALRGAGYRKAYGGAGSYWFLPGNPVVIPESLAPALRTAIVDAVKEALTAAKEQSP
jgi:hypothetical protein